MVSGSSPSEQGGHSGRRMRALVTCPHIQEHWVNACWCSAGFLFFIHSRTPHPRMEPPRMDGNISVKRIALTLHRHSQRSTTPVILDCVELSIITDCCMSTNHLHEEIGIFKGLESHQHEIWQAWNPWGKKTSK